MRSLFLIAVLLCNLAIAENSVSSDYYSVKLDRVANNNLNTGYKIDTAMDMSNGVAGANFSIYALSRCKGAVGSWGVHDCVAVHGTAIKNGNSWVAGGHFDVYDEIRGVSGGTAIGVNIEFPQSRQTTNTIGLNMQSATETNGITAIQIQNPPNKNGTHPFKTIIDGSNGNYIFGMTDETPFGFRFDPVSQKLNFYRAIGLPDETKVHVIDMTWQRAM